MKKHILTNRVGTEISVIAEIVTLLNNRGFCVWRHHASGSFNQKIAAINIKRLRTLTLTEKQFGDAVDNILSRSWRTVPLQKLGVPDVVGFNILTGKFLCVELKIGSDKLTDVQLDFKNLSSNCDYFLVRDFPTFVQFIKTKFCHDSTNLPSCLR